MIEGSGSGSRAGSGSGSIPLTRGSGSGRPKNMWIRIRIRIRNTALNSNLIVLSLLHLGFILRSSFVNQWSCGVSCIATHTSAHHPNGRQAFTKNLLYYNNRYRHWCIRCVLNRDTIRAVLPGRKNWTQKGDKMKKCFFWWVGSFSWMFKDSKFVLLKNSNFLSLENHQKAEEANSWSRATTKSYH